MCKVTLGEVSFLIFLSSLVCPLSFEGSCRLFLSPSDATENCAAPGVRCFGETQGQPDQLRLVSNSDVFTPTGRTKLGVIWDLSVKRNRLCSFEPNQIPGS